MSPWDAKISDTHGPARGSLEPVTTAALELLRSRFGDRLGVGADIRAQHASTLTGLLCQPPDAVIWPESTADVQFVLEVARAHDIPVIPYGAGTSLEGQVNAPRGGLCLDFSRMARILEVRPGDMDVTVEPGITLDQLNAGLRDTGLFFPVDPGAGAATLGGMAATRASGTMTVRHGSMREAVVAVKAVLASGEVISTGTRARKSAAGYDLTHLFVGSEGTLGILVELTLRLAARPAVTLAGVYTFSSMEAVAATTTEAIQSDLLLARIELLDPTMLSVVNAQSGTTHPTGGPALFVEVSGTPEATREHLRLFDEIAAGHGGRCAGHAEADDDRRRLWKARHDCFWSVRSAWPGRTFVVTDVCVPISRLAECLTETIADIAAHDLVAPIVGHVGDGNFHSIVVLEPGDPGAAERMSRYLDRLAARAIRMEGTCTGEHGIGQGKAAYLPAEAGAAVGAMAAIKRAFDPDGILNPGKILPDGGSTPPRPR